MTVRTLLRGTLEFLTLLLGVLAALVFMQWLNCTYLGCYGEQYEQEWYEQYQQRQREWQQHQQIEPTATPTSTGPIAPAVGHCNVGACYGALGLNLVCYPTWCFCPAVCGAGRKYARVWRRTAGECACSNSNPTNRKG